MMTLIKHISLLTACLCCLPIRSAAQEDLLVKADRLRMEYSFDEAADLCRRAADGASDSTLRARAEQILMLCENGTSSLRYVSEPKVRAVRNVPVQEFTLWLPALSGGWAPVPNPLVTAAGGQDSSPGAGTSAACPWQKMTFFPSDAGRIIFSAPAGDGTLDIFETRRETGSQWSAPVPIAELNTPGNEIFPILSRDGGTLWFASDSHPGIGGYDLFVSRWDDSQKQWGVPENLGFPYSSTSDDILYFDTPDGLWSVLVSARDAASGTVNIYMCEFESSPVKSSISGIGAVRKAARLQIADPASSDAESGDDAPPAAVPDSPAGEYVAAVLKLREDTASWQAILGDLGRCRSEYELSSDQDRILALSQEIAALEGRATRARELVDQSTAAVRKAETDLLKKGVIPPEVEQQSPAEPSSVRTEAPSYKFTRQAAISAPVMTVRIPEPVFDYTFRIGKESEIAPDDPLPSGIVYQIQVMAVGAKPAANRFKGISPIFLRKASGKWIGYAGLFRKYDEASRAVQKVRGRGYPNAYVVAYKDGRSISVKTARTQEKNGDGSSYNVILSGYSDGLPSQVKTVISSTCTKDLAKSTVEGATVFIVGPFTSRDEAQTLVSALEAVGAEGVAMEKVAQ